MASYLSEDTIAAIATSLGGAISILRVSGPQAFLALKKLTGCPPSASRSMIRAQLQTWDEKPLDEILFVCFQNPQSYTGEDLVEYHLHGNAHIAYELMQSLAQLQIRQALPGEFSFRAVRNGKMTLFQAQAVADLMEARNTQAITLALEKIQGKANPLLERLGNELREIAMLGELGIDFSDQDVEECSLPQLKHRLQETEKLLHALEKGYFRGKALQEGIPLSICGLPNAGKSTLFNALLQEERSIVSNQAGTTRDLISEMLTLKNHQKSITFRLQDTAGWRKTRDPIETQGIQKAEESIQNAKLVLWLIEAPAFSSSEQMKKIQASWDHLRQVCPDLISKTIGVITKTDLRVVHPSELPRWENIPWVCINQQDPESLSSLMESIFKLCDAYSPKPQEILLTRMEHWQCVTQAIAHVQRAHDTQDQVLFACDLKQALAALTPLIGETPSEDLLERIFSHFCIGK
jgi:tRNA modification GTPase